jgi:hypothetical protein
MPQMVCLITRHVRIAVVARPVVAREGVLAVVKVLVRTLARTAVLVLGLVDKTHRAEILLPNSFS